VPVWLSAGIALLAMLTLFGLYSHRMDVQTVTVQQHIDAIGIKTNTVEKTGHNRYRVWPNDMPADLHKVRPHHPLNRNLDHNWQQA
ncbi:hypothetical protein MJH54_29225, partial [Salmonella enterica subsp. enterica serovar Montevideo]|nr:hypothetical protein [Salmonella enterica subsp. enterica serovar Montevideo]